MATLKMKEVVEFLKVASKTGLSLSVARRHIQQLGEKGVSDFQLTELHRSGLYADLIEASMRVKLDGIDRKVFRQTLGLGHLGEDEVDTEYVIDLGADPAIPAGWLVTYHRDGGVIRWDKDSQKDALYVSKKHRGDELQKELNDNKIPVLNANALDYLLANQKLIPEEWKDKQVFFWGTVYKNDIGYLSVRCLNWNGFVWDWAYRYLGRDWGPDRPAVFYAS